MSRQQTVTLDWAATQGLTLSLGYVGTEGSHLLRVSTPDLGFGRSQFLYEALSRPVPPIPNESFPLLNGTLYSPQQGVRELFPVSRLLFDSSGQSSFHSLQCEIRQSYKWGLQASWSLTWAHSTDDSSDFFDTPSSPALPQSSARPAERASSDYDARFRSTAWFVWDLPFARSSNGIGGWQVTGKLTAQTGQPFTVTSSVDSNHDGNLSDRLQATTHLVFHDGAGDSRLSVAPGVETSSLLNAAGDEVLGRNTFRAAGLADLDLAVVKRFRLKDRSELLLRAEIYNLLNRSNFGIPITLLESASFGSSVQTVTPPRTTQFVVKLRF